MATPCWPELVATSAAGGQHPPNASPTLLNTNRAQMGSIKVKITFKDYEKNIGPNNVITQ